MSAMLVKVALWYNLLLTFAFGCLLAFVPEQALGAHGIQLSAEPSAANQMLRVMTKACGFTLVMLASVVYYAVAKENSPVAGPVLHVMLVFGLIIALSDAGSVFDLRAFGLGALPGAIINNVGLGLTAAVLSLLGHLSLPNRETTAASNKKKA